MPGMTRVRLYPETPVVDSSNVRLVARRASLEDMTNFASSRLPFLPASGIYLPPSNFSSPTSDAAPPDPFDNSSPSGYIPKVTPVHRTPSTRERTKPGYAPSICSTKEWLYQPGVKQTSAPSPEEIADAEAYLRRIDNEHTVVLAVKEAAETTSVAPSTRTVGSRKLLKKLKSMKTEAPPLPAAPPAHAQTPHQPREGGAENLGQALSRKEAKADSGQTRVIPRMFRIVRLPFRGLHRRSNSGPVKTHISSSTPSTSHHHSNSSASTTDIIWQLPPSGIAVAGTPEPRVKRGPKSYVGSLFSLKRRPTLDSQKHIGTPNSKYTFSFRTKRKNKAKAPTATAALTSSARALENKARARLRRSVSFSGYAGLAGLNAILSVDDTCDAGELDEATREAKEINFGLLIPTLRNRHPAPIYHEEDNPVAIGYLFERSVGNGRRI